MAIQARNNSLAKRRSGKFFLSAVTALLVSIPAQITAQSVSSSVARYQCSDGVWHDANSNYNCASPAASPGPSRTSSANSAAAAAAGEIGTKIGNAISDFLFSTPKAGTTQSDAEIAAQREAQRRQMEAAAAEQARLKAAQEAQRRQEAFDRMVKGLKGFDDSAGGLALKGLDGGSSGLGLKGFDDSPGSRAPAVQATADNPLGLKGLDDPQPNAADIQPKGTGTCFFGTGECGTNNAVADNTISDPNNDPSVVDLRDIPQPQLKSPSLQAEAPSKRPAGTVSAVQPPVESDLKFLFPEEPSRWPGPKDPNFPLMNPLREEVIFQQELKQWDDWATKTALDRTRRGADAVPFESLDESFVKDYAPELLDRFKRDGSFRADVEFRMQAVSQNVALSYYQGIADAHKAGIVAYKNGIEELENAGVLEKGMGLPDQLQRHPEFLPHVQAVAKAAGAKEDAELEKARANASPVFDREFGSLFAILKQQAAAAEPK